jgi:hypothetical protein
MISALSDLSISCQVLRFALAFTGLQLNDARMKLSRTDEFFARALIPEALAQEQGQFRMPLRSLQAPVTEKMRGDSQGMVFDRIQP